MLPLFLLICTSDFPLRPLNLVGFNSSFSRDEQHG